MFKYIVKKAIRYYKLKDGTIKVLYLFREFF